MPTNSLVHLLDSNDTDDNNEVPIVKHSLYYGENDFSSMLANKAGLTILSGNIQSIGNTCLFKKGKRKEQRQQYTYKLK